MKLKCDFMELASSLTNGARTFMELVSALTNGA
jgi:hypothetical protein